ncbi:Cell division control protein 3, partial [Colletotrichum sp. SAR 10_70]
MISNLDQPSKDRKGKGKTVGWRDTDADFTIKNKQQSNAGSSPTTKVQIVRSMLDVGKHNSDGQPDKSLNGHRVREDPLAYALPNILTTRYYAGGVVPPMAAPSSDLRNIVRRKLTGYVGFANLPNQWHRKSVRKGFNFNVMVVGESGLGKSTLVNTLFNTSLYPPKERKGPSLDIIPKTVTIQSISADIEEAGVRLRLTVVDTPGFGDFVNNDESWRPIVDNIEQRYDAYLDAENKVNRMNIVDNRIHACVFFIQPTGHSLKPLDIEVMRRLHTKVNLIPVIAKADTLTDEEIANFKSR